MNSLFVINFDKQLRKRVPTLPPYVSYRSDQIKLWKIYAWESKFPKSVYKYPVVWEVYFRDEMDKSFFSIYLGEEAVMESTAEKLTDEATLWDWLEVSAKVDCVGCFTHRPGVGLTMPLHPLAKSDKPGLDLGDPGAGLKGPDID